MSHRLMRIASLVVAGWTIALSGPTALGQPKLKPLQHDFWKTNRWHGSATCTVTARSPSSSDYTNQEFHKWELIPPTLMISQTTSYYWAKWTVTGQGSNADFSWTTNGSGWVILQFWLSSLAAPGIGSGLLNIAESESAPTDPAGITVKSKKDGTISTMSVSEWDFPIIVANPGAINSAQGSPNPPSPPIDGAIFLKEPIDGINTVTCSWDFEYQPVLLTPMPGELCRPDKTDCDEPVIKPPLKR